VSHKSIAIKKKVKPLAGFKHTTFCTLIRHSATEQFILCILKGISSFLYNLKISLAIIARL